MRGWEKFCNPCKPVARKMKVRLHREKIKSQHDFPFGYSGNFQVKPCEHCGDARVPVEHKYLCLHCWRLVGWIFNASDGGQEVKPAKVYPNSTMTYSDAPGPVTLYTSHPFVESRKGVSAVRNGLSQDELFALVPSAQGPFYAVNDPCRPNVRYIYHGQGRHHSTAIERTPECSDYSSECVYYPASYGRNPNEILANSMEKATMFDS